MAVVALEDVSKTYPDGDSEISAIRNVSLEVETGDFITIEGVSGSGKTSLARMLGLLETPDSGSCYFNGTDVTAARDTKRTTLRREHIGWVFSEFKLVPNMTARANIEIAMSYDGVKSKDRTFNAQRLLKQAGLAERAKQRASTLPNGHKQRLAIARALANKPSLIIADEPTNNLDRQSAAIIMKMLSKLPGHGHAVVVTTHDPAIAEHGEQRLRMHKGQLEQEKNTRSSQEVPT